jgi:23S rRNA (cytidine2498-2'-O)-methyltransferase
LLSENKIIACAKTSNPFPSGEIPFVEDKENAPSRAYLKLWETFTVHGVRPKGDDAVLDLGSSPGGWTWVLQQLGCHVISVDKAELDPRLMSDKKIKFIKKDAFKLKPSDVGQIDWFFSDLICYPRKLYDLVQEWRKSGHVKNFVCTIKFQGETDYESLKLFSEIPGSRLVHLFHNKHEIMWILTEETD